MCLAQSFTWRKWVTKVQQRGEYSKLISNNNFVYFASLSSATIIHSESVVGVQTPKNMLKFPQKDWLKTRKLSSLRLSVNQIDLPLLLIHPTTRIPNSSSVRHKNTMGSPAFPFSGPVVSRRERLNSNSSVASVKQNCHHHHQMKFWLCGSHGLSARRAWRTLWSRPEGPQPLPPPPPPPHSTSTTTLPPPPPPSKSVVSRYYPKANTLSNG